MSAVGTRNKIITNQRASSARNPVQETPSLAPVSGTPYLSSNCSSLINLKIWSKICLAKEAIINAIGQTLHYCANILFNSEAEARMFLGRMSRASIGEWFENNNRTFSNDGNAVRFRSDIFEIVFYLKYYDVL